MAIPDILYYRYDKVGFDRRDSQDKLVVPAITEMIIYAVRRSSTKRKLVPVIAAVPKNWRPAGDRLFLGTVSWSMEPEQYWSCLVPREKFRTYACITEGAAFALYPDLPRYLSGKLTAADASRPTAAQVWEEERKANDTATRERMRAQRAERLTP